ncbi:MAG: hypothetical protein ACI9VR_001189 [Cognaticolwellia sp.]|jgi:hypothetical protein
MFGFTRSTRAGNLVGVVSAFVFAVAAFVIWEDMPLVSVVLGGLSAFRVVALVKDRLSYEEEDEEEGEE